jgi:hypothetical protein
MTFGEPVTIECDIERDICRRGRRSAPGTFQF